MMDISGGVDYCGRYGKDGFRGFIGMGIGINGTGRRVMLPGARGYIRRDSGNYFLDRIAGWTG